MSEESTAPTRELAGLRARLAGFCALPVAALALTGFLLAAPAATAAAPPGCPAADPNSNAAGACASHGAIVPSLDPAWSRAYVPPPMPKARAAADCRHLNAVFYAASDWVRLAQKLRANPSACADYYISITPTVADKSKLRPGEAAKIHALGPQMHAMAEINVAGWTIWVNAGNGSWYDAGVEARRRMDAAGFDVAAGDIWALNEMSSAVRQGAGNARANLRALVRGLYAGDGTGPTVRGLVWTAGIAQPTAPLSVYRTNLKNWLKDAAFWADMNGRVRFWSQEVYGDVRKWAVPGADLSARRDTTIDYLEHVSAFSQASPDSGGDMATLMRFSEGPLANAAWAFPSAFGYTNVPEAQMAAYVALQVYALRSDQRRDPWRDGDTFGFAWSPTNNPPPFGMTSAEYVTQSALILDQLAASIHASDVPAGDPGIGACGPEASWCAADIDGATFYAAWHTFGSWMLTPSATDSTAAAVEDTALPIKLVASDPDGEPLAYAVVDQPQHGTLTANGATQTYTPAADFNGVDSFTFQASNGVLASRVATVSIAVAPVNDPPVTSAATSPATPDGANGWFTTPVHVTLTASDVDDPVAWTEAAIDAGPFQLYGGPLTLAGDGPHTLLYRSTDTAGAVEDAKTLAVKVDLGDPTSSAAIAPAIRNGWYATPTVTLTGDDGSGSGIDHVLYRIDGQAGWRTYTGPLNGYSTGNHFIQFQATDVAGRVEPTVDVFAFKADAEPATVRVTRPDDGQVFPLGKAVTAVFKCVDRESGVESCAGTTPNGANLDTSTAGAHTFTVTATDVAGNVTTVTNGYQVVPRG